MSMEVGWEHYSAYHTANIMLKQTKPIPLSLLVPAPSGSMYFLLVTPSNFWLPPTAFLVCIPFLPFVG